MAKKQCIKRQWTLPYSLWVELNPVLALGQIAVISDPDKNEMGFKIGDGHSTFNMLPMSYGDATKIVGEIEEGAIPAMDASGNLVNSHIHYDDYDQSFDLSLMGSKVGYLDESGEYISDGVHWTIPVQAGDRFRLFAAQDKQLQYAWLTEDGSEGAVAFVQDTTLVKCPQGSITRVEAPDGATLLALNISVTIRSVTQTFEPAAIMMTGGKFTLGIRSLLADAAAMRESIQELVTRMRDVDAALLTIVNDFATESYVNGLVGEVNRAVQSLQQHDVLISESAFAELEDSDEVDPTKVYYIYEDEEEEEEEVVANDQQ